MVFCANIRLMFKTYDLKIKKILSGKNKDIDWEHILKNHKNMIKRIQHERLIHLLVMIFVGIVMSFSSITTIVFKETSLLFLDVPLIILFLFYIFHYYFLENTTQNWYTLEDKIKELEND
jgi:hypothetical protein